jgi:hypothetical protein
MQLTELQLEIQKLWADNTLSFGCIIEIWWEDVDVCTWKCWETHIFWNNYRTIDIWWISKIIWHPITYSRLCYLFQCNGNSNTDVLVNEIIEIFSMNPELYNQTILERNEEVLNSVRDFLLSIQ